MRLSLLTPLGIAALLGVGIAAMDVPDANALARRTVITKTPGGTTVITRTRHPRWAFARPWHGARGSVIVRRPGLRCHTVIVNGVPVHRCF